MDNENVYHHVYNLSENYNIFPPEKITDYDHQFLNKKNFPPNVHPPNPQHPSIKLLNPSQPLPSTTMMIQEFNANQSESQFKVVNTPKLMNKLHADFNKFTQENKGISVPNSSQLNTPLQTMGDEINAFIRAPPSIEGTPPSIGPHFAPNNIPLPPPADSQPVLTNNPNVTVSLERDIWNQRGLNSMMYPFVYRDKPFFQLPQSNLILNPQPIYLAIDSRTRDRRKWPNPARYRIPLVGTDQDEFTSGERYKNIYSISLLSAVVPNVNNILDELYIILEIDEIDSMYDSPSPPCAKAFTKLHFSESSGAFLRLDKGVGDPLTRIFYPKPLASLSSLTISFKRFDGTLFDFGVDTVPPTPSNNDIQNSLTLEIMTKVVDVNQAIGHRNV